MSLIRITLEILVPDVPPGILAHRIIAATEDLSNLTIYAANAVDVTPSLPHPRPIPPLPPVPPPDGISVRESRSELRRRIFTERLKRINNRPLDGAGK